MADFHETNVSTGQEFVRQATRDELDNLAAVQAELATQVEAEQAAVLKREAALAVVEAKAAKDPAFAALLELLK